MLVVSVDNLNIKGINFTVEVNVSRYLMIFLLLFNSILNNEYVNDGLICTVDTGVAVDISEENCIISEDFGVVY